MKQVIKFILLDWDGTVVDSIPSIEHTTLRAFDEAGFPAPKTQEIHTAIADGHGLEFFLKQLSPALNDTNVEAFKLRWREIYNAEAHEYTEIFPQAKETITYIFEAGLGLGIFSNKGIQALLGSVEKTGMAPYMSMILGDEPGKPKKPHKEAYLSRVAPLLPHIDPAQILMVGDSQADLRFGRVFGGKTCFAAYGYGKREICMAEHPDIVIEHITELAEILE